MYDLFVLYVSVTHVALLLYHIDASISPPYALSVIPLQSLDRLKNHSHKTMNRTNTEDIRKTTGDAKWQNSTLEDDDKTIAQQNGITN